MLLFEFRVYSRTLLANNTSARLRAIIMHYAIRHAEIDHIEEGGKPKDDNDRTLYAMTLQSKTC